MIDRTRSGRSEYIQPQKGTDFGPHEFAGLVPKNIDGTVNANCLTELRAVIIALLEGVEFKHIECRLIKDAMPENCNQMRSNLIYLARALSVAENIPGPHPPMEEPRIHYHASQQSAVYPPARHCQLLAHVGHGQSEYLSALAA
jgi:hypothetical protein